MIFFLCGSPTPTFTFVHVPLFFFLFFFACNFVLPFAILFVFHFSFFTATWTDIICAFPVFVSLLFDKTASIIKFTSNNGIRYGIRIQRDSCPSLS
jgi:hypothetical protein